MVNGPRQTQHRPSRDTAKGRELAQAKQKVKELTRQVARLQRRLEKHGNIDPVEEDPVPTLIESEAGPGIVTDSAASNPNLKPDPNACACGSEDFIEVPTPGGKVIRICKGCKNRKIVPSGEADETKERDQH